jgi:glycosyltransferase involved in cell wall biosynthesis
MTSATTSEAAAETTSSKAADALRPKLRVAIIQYWLTSYGGAERVLEQWAELFPHADFYTLVASEDGIPPALRGRNVKASFVNRLPGAKRWHRHFLPFYPLALEQFDLNGYDLVISSESGPAKGVITAPWTCHICYCHTPMRYLWDMYHEYRKKMNPLTRTIFSVTAHYAREWDLSSASRVDYFAANSRHIAARIRKYYRRESTVIYPPVNVSAGYISQQIEDYYLVVGRLVPYKRIDLAVEACNRLGRRLLIVGVGPEYKRLRKLAGPTIQFLGKVEDFALRDIYAHCRALLFPAEEDFGIVPVEAQSFGRPVIAYGRGGVLETVTCLLPGRDPEGASGMFFQVQSPEALGQAIVAFEENESSFRADWIRAQALRFDSERFKEQFTNFIADRLTDFRKSADG